jgi:hypothetical protein
MFGKLPFFRKSRQPVAIAESVYFYTLHKCASGLFSALNAKQSRSGVPGSVIFFSALTSTPAQLL